MIFLIECFFNFILTWIIYRENNILEFAAGNENVEILKLLLLKKKFIFSNEQTTISHIRMIYYSIKKCNLEICKALLSVPGFDVNEKYIFFIK